MAEGTPGNRKKGDLPSLKLTWPLNAPENEWLEDEFPFGKPLFSGAKMLVSGRVRLRPSPVHSVQRDLPVGCLKLSSWDHLEGFNFFHKKNGEIST